MMNTSPTKDSVETSGKSSTSLDETPVKSSSAGNSASAEIKTSPSST